VELSFAPALLSDELVRSCKFECTNICTTKSSIASLGGLKPCGIAWRRRRCRRSFFLRTKWKLHEKERFAERGKGKRGRGKKRT